MLAVTVTHYYSCDRLLSQNRDCPFPSNPDRPFLSNCDRPPCFIPDRLTLQAARSPLNSDIKRSLLPKRRSPQFFSHDRSPSISDRDCDRPGFVVMLSEPITQALTIDAIVVLPDHLHCVWTLPEGDADFSKRWRLIKSEFSRHCPKMYKQQRSASRLAKGEQAIWQRRFWEHQIRDE